MNAKAKEAAKKVEDFQGKNLSPERGKKELQDSTTAIATETTMNDSNQKEEAAANGDAVPANAEIDSPKKQMSKGIASEDVLCREGLELVIRTNGNAST